MQGANVVLHPAADVGPEDFHGASRQPVAKFLRYLSATEQDQIRSLFPSGLLYARGTSVGRDGVGRTHWNKIQPGDLALFFRANRLIGSGEVVLKKDSAMLAADLNWLADESSPTPYHLIYIVREIKEWNIGRPEVWRAIGYSPQDQFRFSVVSDDRATHLIEWLIENETITREQFVALILRRQDRIETDRAYTSFARIEQGFWRRQLLTNRTSALCSICGRLFPVAFLVMAHIKRRADCSREERLDPYNVIPMCLFGRDALFENRIVTVGTDGFTDTHEEVSTADLKRLITGVDHKRVPKEYWDERRVKYFRQHAGQLNVS
jgi:hypothetical protein